MQSRQIITWAIVAAAILAGAFIYLISSPTAAPTQPQPLSTPEIIPTASPTPQATPIITVQLEPSASPAVDAIPMTAPTGPTTPLLGLAGLAAVTGSIGLLARAYTLRRLFQRR